MLCLKLEISIALSLPIDISSRMEVSSKTIPRSLADVAGYKKPLGCTALQNKWLNILPSNPHTPLVNAPAYLKAQIWIIFLRPQTLPKALKLGTRLSFFICLSFRLSCVTHRVPLLDSETVRTGNFDIFFGIFICFFFLLCFFLISWILSRLFQIFKINIFFFNLFWF